MRAARTRCSQKSAAKLFCCEQEVAFCGIRKWHMPFVESFIMEGAQEYDWDAPTWDDVHEALARLDGSTFHTLTLIGRGGVQLGVSMGSNGRIMVNWHSWTSDESWVIVATKEDEHATVLLEGAEYPARQFVAPSIAAEAARAFFDDGARLAEVTWESPG